MTIKVIIKQVYGVDTIYPANSEAKLIAAIAGTKTLTPDTIDLVKQLGYEIQIEQPTYTL